MKFVGAVLGVVLVVLLYIVISVYCTYGIGPVNLLRLRWAAQHDNKGEYSQAAVYYRKAAEAGSVDAQ
ncbi:MAG: hypothetical protein MR727_00065, partial [Lentisphaeria bacterium]|nr:hypothetical protein [Lentisphaeria bacterium]